MNILELISLAIDIIRSCEFPPPLSVLLYQDVQLCRSVQILPNQLLGSVGQHPGGFPVDNMCLSHDGTYVVTSSQDSCHFWSASHIPTLPPTESEEGGVTKKRKRKRKQKHRDITTQELVRTKKSQQVDFFADLCNN